MSVIFGIFNKNSYNYSILHIIISMYLMSTCLVHNMVVILLAIIMVPTLSTHTMTGSLTEFFMLPSNWITNITSCTVSDKATHSVSQLDSITLLWDFDWQENGTPKMYRMNPLMHFLLTGSPAYSLSLKQTFSKGLLAFPNGSNLNITYSNSQNTAGFAPSFIFDNCMMTLAVSHLQCFTRNSFLYFVETFSLSIVGLTIKNFDAPGNLWLQTFLIQSQNTFSRFSMRWGSPK